MKSFVQNTQTKEIKMSKTKLQQLSKEPPLTVNVKAILAETEKLRKILKDMK